MNINKIKKQRGISIAMILASIIALGIIAYLGTTVYTSIIGGNQRSNLSIQSSQNLTQASYILSTEITRNASGIPVAKAILANGFAPSGGGIIPLASAAPKLDAFGSYIGYCVNAAPATQTDPVFAIISAGADKNFNTTCAQAFVGTNIGDDKVITKNVASINQGVGGTVFFGDPVPTVADLATLTAASIKPGQLRTVLADGTIWVNKTGVVGAAAWEKAGAAGGSGSGGSGGGGPTVMYLEGVPAYSSSTPASCPTSWIEVDYKVINANPTGAQYVYRRTCTNPAPFSIMYLEGVPAYSSSTPAACPTSWTEADYKVINSTPTGSQSVYRRTCYIAQTVGSGGSNSSGGCMDTGNAAYSYIDDSNVYQTKNYSTSGVMGIGTSFVDFSCSGSGVANRARMSVKAWNSFFAGTTKVPTGATCTDGLNNASANLRQCTVTTPITTELVSGGSQSKHVFSNVTSTTWTGF